MSVVSVNIPENIGISASGSPAGIAATGKSLNELTGRKVSTNKDDATKKTVSAQFRKTPETKSGCVRN